MVTDTLFTDVDKLLLDEARARFDFEHKLAVALQAKSTFFLAVAAAFSGLVATAIARVLEESQLSRLAFASILLFTVTLVLLAICGVLLVRSALTLSYSTPASISKWIAHASKLRAGLVNSENAETRILNQLRQDLLISLVEAADSAQGSNEAKARSLLVVGRLLALAIPIVLAAILVMFLSRLLP